MLAHMQTALDHAIPCSCLEDQRETRKTRAVDCIYRLWHVPPQQSDAC
jgi:hypothetical protein